jgi:hypothetical protein
MQGARAFKIRDGLFSGEGSECVTFLIFSTPVMLSASAGQAAVESKHPMCACVATIVDTFSATVS